MKNECVIGAIVTGLVVLSLGVIFLSPNEQAMKLSNSDATAGTEKAVPFVEIVNPSGFVNTDNKQIKIADYVGKQVILLDVMTYSCINCQRTFPYVNAWYEKYKDDGLVVIGIHTPEFAFEKDKHNVEKAFEEFGIKFPVVLDNDYATWQALGNKYWPRKYLIDIHGNIVYDHIGEGAYTETEEKIQELLRERATVLGTSLNTEDELVVSGIEEVKTSSQSPETYFGSLRNERLANGIIGKTGLHVGAFPPNIQPNALYLGGSWDITKEYAEAREGAVVKYRYNAKEVYIVAESEGGGVIEVWQDNALVEEEAGADAPASHAEIRASRLYKLIKNPEAGEHILELRVTPGVKLFAFTFG